MELLTKAVVVSGREQSLSPSFRSSLERFHMWYSGAEAALTPGLKAGAAAGYTTSETTLGVEGKS